MIRRDDNGKAQLVLLDHGLYQILTPAIRHNLCNFWEAIILKDLTAMEYHAKALNVNGNCINYSKYIFYFILTQKIKSF